LQFFRETEIMSLPLIHIIESIIFVSEQPVSASHILEVVQRPEGEEQQITQTDVEMALAGLLEKYGADIYPFEIRNVAGGYQFFTKREFYPFVKDSVLLKNKRRLTRSALETLSIIAYRQPVARAELEFIRGVNCDYAIQKLLEKKLIDIAGRSDGPGRPLLYVTSEYFMQHFGLKDISDLPKLKEFEEMAEDQMEMFRRNQQGENGAEAHNEKTEENELLERDA
jgi:segregation and condensation protein B